jgi:hypothetical protein
MREGYNGGVDVEGEGRSAERVPAVRQGVVESTLGPALGDLREYFGEVRGGLTPAASAVRTAR